MAFATILTHDTDDRRARRIPGTVAPALADLGVPPRVASFVAGPDSVPDPEDSELVVVMGSAQSADDDALPWIEPELAYLRRAVDLGVPVLGICFGGQALARVLGGTVGRAPRPERGFVDVDVLDPDAVPASRWMQFHGDAFTLPPGARELARNEVCLQGFAAGRHTGVQFHPEITPDVFAAWGEAFAESPAARDADPMTLPARERLAAITAEIAERADPAARACRELVAAFRERAGSAESAAQQPIRRVAR